MVAPYGEWELEADGEDALRDFGCPLAKWVGGRVEGWRVGGIGRVVPAHVEALHVGQMSARVERVVR